MVEWQRHLKDVGLGCYDNAFCSGESDRQHFSMWQDSIRWSGALSFLALFIGFESYIQRNWVQFENWNPLNSPHPFPYRSFYQPLSFLQPKQLAELDIPPGCLIPNQPMVAGAHWQGWETGPQQGSVLWVGMALPVFLWWQIKTIKDTGVVIHTKKGDGFAYLEGFYDFERDCFFWFSSSLSLTSHKIWIQRVNLRLTFPL